MAVRNNGDVAYLFLDEGGNFDFTRNGTKYFTMTAVSTRRPFACSAGLQELRFDLLEEGRNVQHFHATEDSQDIRNRVFSVLESHLADFKADSIIVDKCKTGPSLRPPEVFYPKVLGLLLKYVFRGSHISSAKRIIVMTDALPMRARRKAIERGIRKHLPKMIPAESRYQIFHHDSKSCSGLQIADYTNWAIYRKWNRRDIRSYGRIAPCVRSEFDVFRHGEIIWY